MWEELYDYMESIYVPGFIIRELQEATAFIKDPTPMMIWTYNQFISWYKNE